METSVAGFTSRVAEALTSPDVIPMLVVPTAKVVARPCVPAELLTVATAAFVELQCADWVISCVVPSV
jgi:hypothetical protein